MSRIEKLGLILLLVLAVAFGCLVVKRAAFMKRRMTDVDCYLRAAWAIRSGEDLYEVQDTNDWHYNYPPIFAILMTPLANPPPGADRTGMLPFSVSVAIWYGLSLAFLAGGVHWLASAIEQTSDLFSRPPSNLEGAESKKGQGFNGDVHPPSSILDPRFSVSRRGWGLRIIPVLGCLLPIGHTLMRGQVNLLLLFLLCGQAAATLQRRNHLAGWCLAGAICLKVIPAFLLLFPLWRRDGRCLAGCVLGLVVLGGAIPMLVFGPLRTVHYYKEYSQVLLGPALGVGSDQSRAKEMIETTANDSQSLQAALHNTLHPIRALRPAQPTLLVRWIPRLVGVTLTFLTLGAASWRRSISGADVALFLGALVINMLLLSPICHLHYFSLCVLIVMGLVASRWEGQNQMGLGKGLILIFAFNIVCYIPPNIPSWLVLRDLAVTLYPTLVLWAAGTLVLWKRSRQRSGDALDPLVHSRQAA